jgi:hypothetical protein
MHHQAAVVSLGTCVLVASCLGNAISTPTVLAESQAARFIPANNLNIQVLKTPSPLSPQGAPIAQTVDENELTQEQKDQLSSLGTLVLVPTYLPSGLRLTKLGFGKELIDNDSYAYYSILYQGDDNTCLEISSGVDLGMPASRLPTQDTVPTQFGSVTVYSGITSDVSTIQIVSLLPTKQGHMIRSGLVMNAAKIQPDGTWTKPEVCNPVSLEEFTQVLKSLTSN